MPNRRTGLPGTLSIAALVWLTAAPGSGQTPESVFLEALKVEIVNVEVYVADKKGDPITDLTLKDFQLQEDGRKVKITNFSVVGGTTSRVEATGGAGGARTR